VVEAVGQGRAKHGAAEIRCGIQLAPTVSNWYPRTGWCGAQALGVSAGYATAESVGGIQIK
jgi:hypothetical protein